jgi:hypothetical protein
MRTTRRAADQAGRGVGRGVDARAGRCRPGSSVRVFVLAAACASALLMTAVPAAAHGPCGCIRPAAARPGEQLVSTVPTIKLIWNPVPSDLLIGPDYLGRDHVDGQPRVVLQEQPQPAVASFQVPATAPGRYLVLMYDGTEGGVHYSWDYITVRPGSSSASSTGPTVVTTATAHQGGRGVPVLAVLSAALLALLAVGRIVWARKHGRDSGRLAS